MKLPLGFGSLDWSDWGRGVIAAFIGGGSSAVTAAFVAPALTPDLAAGTGKWFALVGSMFAMSGTINMFSFLRTKPLPDLKTVTTTVSSVTAPGTPPITVKTVAETHTESPSEGAGH